VTSAKADLNCAAEARLEKSSVRLTLFKICR
jgi:hypothetical protein